MAKSKLFTDEDDALLAELGVEVEQKKMVSHTPQEERVIAGFEEIQKFVEQNRRVPEHGEDKDIFERIYAARLDRIRTIQEFLPLLVPLDKQGLLAESNHPEFIEDTDDETLLAQLGIAIDSAEDDITHLKYVKTREQIRAEADYIANRTPCTDFTLYKELFNTIKIDLEAGVKQAKLLIKQAEIAENDWFILNGQIAYIDKTYNEFVNNDDREDMRLRVIFDNGTESNLLMRSMQKALLKDDTARRIIPINAGPLFADEASDDDLNSGTIYVLRSLSEQPEIKQYASLLHKIGVTGGDVQKRIVNAKLDPTFLLSDVEVVATYELYHIDRVKLENLVHRFFEEARLDIQLNDRFGHPINPREWFLVPLFVIDEVVSKIKDGSLHRYRYDIGSACLRKVDR